MAADRARWLLIFALAGSLVVYAAIAGRQAQWGSAIAAVIVAGLLSAAHRRARFVAYVFFTGLAIRGALTGAWALLLYAAIAVAVMQTAPARRAWPQLVRGRLLEGGDRMRRS